MLLAQVEINQKTFAPAKFANIGILLNIVLPILTTGAAIIFLVFMLRSAFSIITHGDNPEEISKAQKSMGFAILGLVIVIISFVIVRVIGQILGIQNILPL